MAELKLGTTIGGYRQLHEGIDSPTLSGQLTLKCNETYALKIDTTTDGKIILSGSSNPYIRFQESTTDKQYIQWNNAGYLYLRNQEDGSGLRIKDQIDFTKDGTTFYTVWHQGNDGSGSGLDQDKLDGLHQSSFVRSDQDDTVTGTLTFSKIGEVIRIGGSSQLDSQDAWIYMGNATYAWRLKYVGSTGGNGGNEFRIESTSTGKYFQMDHDGNIEYYDGSTIQKIWHQGNDGSGSGLDQDKLDGLHQSSFLRSDTSDTMSGTLTFSSSKTGGWGGRTGSPAINFNNSDIIGLNAIVFSDLSNGGTEGIVFPIKDSPSTLSDFSTLTGYSDRQLYWYPDSNSSTKYKIWHQGNDGSGSGLDQDKLDGLHQSSFLRSDTSDTMSGTLTITGDILFPSSVSGKGIKWDSKNNPGSDYQYIRYYQDQSEIGQYDLSTGSENGTLIIGIENDLQSSTGDQIIIKTGSRLVIDQNASTQSSSNPLNIVEFWNEGSRKAYINTSGIMVLPQIYINNSSTKILEGQNNQIRLQTNNGYIDIGPQNTSYAHIYTDRQNFYFNKDLLVNGNKVWHQGNDGSGSGSDQDKLDGLHQSSFLRSDTSDTMSGNLTVNGNITQTKVYGAVFNDYQEYRIQDKEIKPGYVVLTTESGRIIKCNKDRQKNVAGIVSDTFGFQIGKIEDKTNVPIQVQGRVLVYQKDKSKLKLGDQVCSTEDGKVRKMRWWEKILFPEQIIGIVDEIPTYKKWGTNNVDVDGRIWIKIK